MDQHYERRDAERFVVIVDRDGRVVAREQTDNPEFALYANGQLPVELTHLLRSTAGKTQVHMLESGHYVRIIPIKGTDHRLAALVIEKLRLRSET